MKDECWTRVRTMDGQKFSIRFDSCDRKITDLKLQLLGIIDENRTTNDAVRPAVVGLRLVHGVKLLCDSDLLVELWPPGSKFLDVDMIVQKAVGKDDISLAASYLLSTLDCTRLYSTTERLARIEMTTPLEQKAVADAIVKSACARGLHPEAYADLTCALQRRYKELPPERDGQRLHNFRHMCVSSLQEKFVMCLNAEKPDSSNGDLLSLARFCGHLFNKQILCCKVVAQILKALIWKNENPAEYLVLCACEILEVSKSTLRESVHGNPLLMNCIRRLKSLPNGYSDEICECIAVL